MSAMLVAQLILGLGGLSPASMPVDRPRSAPVCREHDHGAVLLLARIRFYTEAQEGDNAMVRDSLRLPSVPASGVRLIVDEAVCHRAARAYFGLLHRNLDTVSGRVYVVQAGDRYAVVDPAWSYSLQRRHWLVAILDQEFRPVAYFHP